MLLNYGARCGRKVRNDEDSLKARAASGQGFLSLRVLHRPHERSGLSRGGRRYMESKQVK